MAKPRIFVSSTFYDLKHIRASLENFIDGLGFEAILSEKGHIPYAHDEPLDESCYKEVHTSDIFVMIIGGRYGSEKSSTRKENRSTKDFLEVYDSVTKEELNTAIRKDIPVYIFIEKAVYADYETYLKNLGNPTVNYAHVDSVNTLRLIEEILKLRRNNPVYQFERYGEIENWLRTQWAGRFRDLLQSKSEKAQIASLQAQVDAMAALNQTLQSYLEKIITNLDPSRSAQIIAAENKQLQEARLSAVLRNSKDFDHMIRGHDLKPEDAISIVRDSTSIREARERLDRKLVNSCGAGLRADAVEINGIRETLNLPPFIESEEDTMALREARRNLRYIRKDNAKSPSGKQQKLKFEIERIEEQERKVSSKIHRLQQFLETIDHASDSKEQANEAKTQLAESKAALLSNRRKKKELQLELDKLNIENKPKVDGDNRGHIV